MGRTNNAPSPKMNHFSHPHELEIWSTTFQPQQGLMPSTSTTLCSACQLPSNETMYICHHCNFPLHLTCAQFPQRITHSAHKNHTLILLPVAAYPGGIFNCDACNRQGNGFSYHCGSCEYDLHVLCASKPLKLTHQSHCCQLELTFTNPYHNTKGFSCDICHKFGSKQWLYRCGACEFDVHLDCATTASPAPPPPPVTGMGVQVQSGQLAQLLQHHRSFPGANFHNQIGSSQSTQLAQTAQSGQTLQLGRSHVLQHPRQYMHSLSLGANTIAQQQQVGLTGTSTMGMGPVMHGSPVARPNVLMHTASTGAVGNVGRLPTRTSGLMNSVIQGLVDGAAQQIGQSLVQGVIDGGAGGGSGAGGDESSILGSLFGDSLDTPN